MDFRHIESRLKAQGEGGRREILTSPEGSLIGFELIAVPLLQLKSINLHVPFNSLSLSLSLRAIATTLRGAISGCMYN